MKKKFKFHWKTGRASIGEGTSPEDAFTHLGYGAGAVPALDYYEEIKEEDGITNTDNVNS